LVNKEELITDNESFRYCFDSFDKDCFENIFVEDFKELFRIKNLNVVNVLNINIDRDKLETENISFDEFNILMKSFIKNSFLDF